jgi:tartrate dehydrogenase/decarboxylase/D-malate dehydrogenase
MGKEVVPEGIRVLDAAGQRFGFQFAWHFFDWSCEAYLKTGQDDARRRPRSVAAL